MTPQKEINGLTFFPVPDVSDVDMALGARASRFFNRRNLPDVPRQFKDMAENLFFNGGNLPDLSPKVDRVKATRVIRAWLGSFAPAHEAKIATVGYALWLWTDQASLND